MISSTIEIHNIKDSKKDEIGQKTYTEDNFRQIAKTESANPNYKYLCPIKQLLIIVIPITVVLLFAAIFIPVYIVENDKDDDAVIQDEEFDEFDVTFENLTYAILTPKDGYDNIFIFLGGIGNAPKDYFTFFQSKNTIIPKGTKIYSISGTPRNMEFAYQYHMLERGSPCYGWFNVDASANLINSNSQVDNSNFDEAKASKELILNEIDRIQQAEQISYSKIYLGGFSQGAIMVNYLLLNSRHKLGGYLAFSGFIFDEVFIPPNQVATTLSDEQKAKLDAKKDYHILAAHSFNDNAVPYPQSIVGYYTYFKDYTDFTLYSFGDLTHKFPEQPTNPSVKKWLKESMGK